MRGRLRAQQAQRRPSRGRGPLTRVIIMYIDRERARQFPVAPFFRPARRHA